MFITVCKSKIHRATVTEANLNYIGSITIAEDLMETANLLPNERVQVLNLDNGSRLETYVIPGEAGSGVICLNGAAAHLIKPGDIVIIVSYAIMTPEEAKNWRPQVVFVDEQNVISNVTREERPFTTE